MAGQSDHYPRLPPSVTTEELRRRLSQVLSRAAYGIEPVVVTRRGLKIAAIVSMDDYAFLLRKEPERVYD